MIPYPAFTSTFDGPLKICPFKICRFAPPSFSGLTPLMNAYEFVKTKIALEKLEKNQYLAIHIKKGEALDGLPESLKEIGFKISKKKVLKADIYYLEINPLNLGSLS